MNMDLIKDFTGCISLDGNWEFYYSPTIEEHNTIYDKLSSGAGCTMPVPGYWDDNVDRIALTECWNNIRLNPDFKTVRIPGGTNLPDASLPYIVGYGWYKKEIFVPEEWKDNQVFIHFGGVRLETVLWVNGVKVGYHKGHSTPFGFCISGYLNYGEINCIAVCVSNTAEDRSGCGLRGYIGRSAGIYRPVSLKVCGNVLIEDYHIYYNDENDKIIWNVKISNPSNHNGKSIQWHLKNKIDQIVLGEGIKSISGDENVWETENFGLKMWSDNNPVLYSVEIKILDSEKLSDSITRDFGLRTIKVENNSILLNGRHVILRGVTECGYFPLTCTPPLDIDTYRNMIKRLKEIGFNWLRFHTWVPSEEYMQAADELGILIHVEPPAGFEEAEWIDILKNCRKHPSVIIYCCGNEELLDDKKIEVLEKMASLCKEMVPDSLFNPQEALRGVEYFYVLDPSEMGEDIEEQPFKHNHKRLRKLKEFSDVFGQYTWGLLSYATVNSSSSEIDKRLSIYEKPCLAHEMGILNTFIDLDLELRYENTRIGTGLYKSTREYLKKEGMLSKASLYYHNSCMWMKALMKNNIETSRKCAHVKGYDYLGGTDLHWHRTGYNCGIMNEFFELKHGLYKEDILKFNNENILMLDYPKNRNLNSGKEYEMVLYSSLYGEKPLINGIVQWSLTDNSMNFYEKGQVNVGNIECGRNKKLQTLKFEAPAVSKPVKLRLSARLSGDNYAVDNDWDFWIFPRLEYGKINAQADGEIIDRYCECLPCLMPVSDSDKSSARVVSELNMDHLTFLMSGGSIVLIGSKPFRTLPLSFSTTTSGRVEGNVATVIYDHPVMMDFPHDGYCDWQFYPMMTDACAIVFDNMDNVFEPIIEIVSSYKRIRKQAAMFEANVGEGKLFVCSLNLNKDDPGAMHILKSILAYVSSERFKPVAQIETGLLRNNDLLKGSMLKIGATDMAFDIRVQK